MKGSDNRFPKLILAEQPVDGGSLPDAPAGHRTLFLGEDGLLYTLDDYGAVAALLPPGLLSDPLTTKGDLIVRGAVTGRLGAGASGQVLTADSAAPLGVKWATVAVGSYPAAPDRPPDSPSAYDDEFDGDLSAWTVWGSLDSASASGSLLRMSKHGSGVEINGLHRACPPLPFTVTISIVTMTQSHDFDTCALYLADSTPAKALSWSTLWTAGLHVEAGYYTARTTRTSAPDLGATPAPVRRLRMVVASASAVDLCWSWDGLLWTTASTVNPGFTPAFAGISIGPMGGAQTTQAFIDWIRVDLGSPGDHWDGEAWVP